MDTVNPHKHDAASSDAADWRQVDWQEHTHAVTLPGGEQVSYVEIGPESGDRSSPVLLLVHGLGGSWHAWLENLLAWSADHRVIAVDLPGFGASPAQPGVTGFASYARVLDELCSELAIPEVVVAGSSFGGWVSAELTRRHPDLVAGLVLLAAAGIPATPKERRKVATMLRLAGRLAPYASRNRVKLTATPKRRRRTFGFMIADPAKVPADLALHLIPETPSPVFRAVLETAISDWSPAWCDQLTVLDVPTLVVWGERDRQLPLRHAQEWNRLLQGSELVVVPGAGHLPMLERPDVVNPLVANFISVRCGDRRRA